jgi:hypothetical protein
LFPGAKAKDVKRGNSNLSSFVRTGCHSAIIVLTLANEDFAAYKPDVFG